MSKGFVAEFDAYRHLGWYYCHNCVTSWSDGTDASRFVRIAVTDRFGKPGVVVDDPEKVKRFAEEQLEIFMGNHPRAKVVTIELEDRWGTCSLKVGGVNVIRFEQLISVYLSHNVTSQSDDNGEQHWAMFPFKKWEVQS